MSPSPAPDGGAAEPTIRGAARGATVPRPTPAALLRSLAVALGVGLPVAAVAFGFLALSRGLEEALWKTLPDQLGFSGADWWWVLVAPTVGGVLSALAVRRLPGGGGHEPIAGFTPDPVLPRAVPGVLLAALASLSFGAVLGPEAPLIALGSALGLWFARLARLSDQVAPMAAAAGLFASISALFENPLPAAFLVLEAVGMAASGAPLAAVVLPGMLAAASGYLLISGLQSWSGLEVSGFPLLDLPEYATVRIGDLFWALVLGVVLAVAVRIVGLGAHAFHRVTVRRPGIAAPGAGLLVGVAAVVFAATTDQQPHLVLFSGETSAATVAASGASWGAATLVMLLLLKGLAYSVSLGSLFRGGPVFPALFLGVAAGVLLSTLVPDVSPTASVVAGMAAATSAMLRLPLSAVLLAVVLGGTNAVEATSLALIASAAAFVTIRVLQRDGRGPDADTTGPRP
jgi:chloride channel protein, CIC family